MFKRIKIRTNILLHFLSALLLVALALIGTQYYFSTQMAKEATERTFHQTLHKVAITLQSKDHLSKEILYQIESYPSISNVKIEPLPMNTIEHFIHTLKRYPNMYAIYLGYGNGDLFEVINMKVDANIHTHYHAPKETRWSIIRVYTAPQGRIRRFTFLDRSYKILAERIEPSHYTVTSRPWYTEALHADKAVRSDPYLFTNLQQKGITFSKRLQHSDTVLALDFTLKEMQQLLQSIHFSQSGNIYIFGRNHELISTPTPEAKHYAPLLQKMIRDKEIDRVKIVHTTHGTIYAMVTPLSNEMGKATYVGISIDQAEMLAPYREKLYYALAIALVLLIISIPIILYLTDHIIRPIKALMRENEMIKQRKFDRIKPINTNIVEFIELSNSQIAMSQSIQDYQQQLETLLDSFIKLIADAIDAKSAYTGSHCKKVPVIATMLAEEAEAAKEGPLSDFCFESREQRKAFERAAWLHDCGKITTPEYVVDKATKLETIYNRIHEIRTRFEVLWRDVEITALIRIIEGESPDEAARWKRSQQQRLQEEFTLIATCNIGSELTEASTIARIHSIGEQTWERHFDDRLGLSEEELKRFCDAPAPLPAVEKLLSDKPEHRIERSGFDLRDYEKEGFKMAVPQWLYNRGEIYNLSVAKGTLTPEERYKINEHVIMTIKMLEKLPFPDAMKEIPKIAGEHHETMDGTGYPRQLTQEALSIPSRIMAIADIFEALTASDRPYTQGKTLSKTLQIMYQMKQEHHIDPALFDLFIRSKVYLRYARDYLHPEQIDEVDEAALLG